MPWDRIAALVRRYSEAAIIGLSAPALVFPNRLTPFILPIFPALWLVRWRLHGYPVAQSVLNKPLLILMAMTLVSLYPSIDLGVSMPKFLGMLLGMMLFFGVVHTVQSRRDALALGWLVVAVGVGASLLALVGTNWMTSKFGLAALNQHLPRLITSVQTSQQVAQGFHPNEVGGTLALVLPLTLAVTAGSRAWFPRMVASFTCVLVAATLVLTQSRSAFLGTAIALLMFGLTRKPLFLLGLPVAVAGLVVSIQVVDPESILAWLFPAQTDALVDTWASRVELWQRAWYMILDFPLTGVGLNTFPQVVDLLYPLWRAPDASAVAHAHNLFLQTAVDFGIPGLLAFTGILFGFYCSLWHASRRVQHDGQLRWLVRGLAGGVLAHLAFGLTDAVTLGAKPGVILWLMLGLGIALERLTASGTALAGSK